MTRLDALRHLLRAYIRRANEAGDEAEREVFQRRRDTLSEWVGYECRVIDQIRFVAGAMLRTAIGGFTHERDERAWPGRDAFGGRRRAAG